MQPRSQGLSALLPREAGKRNPGNEVGVDFGTPGPAALRDSLEVFSIDQYTCYLLRYKATYESTTAG